MRTHWEAQRDRILAEYGVVGDELPDVTTTAMTDIESADPPVRRGRPITVTKALRQIRPTSEKVTPERSRSWWEDVPVGQMTKTADQQRERMQSTREWRQVAGSIGV